MPPSGPMKEAIGLGWRVHSWEAVVVAVTGPAASPSIVHRDEIVLLDDASVREPYHIAASLVGNHPGQDAERAIDEAAALIASVENDAALAVAALMRSYVARFGSIAAIGLVGGSRRLPSTLRQRLATHARWHASERQLYEEAILRGAADVGVPATAIPATGSLFKDASRSLGVSLEPLLTALGKSIGPPWKKTQKEAAAAALVALSAIDDET